MKHIKKYEDITNKYSERNSEDPSKFIEGFIIYDDFFIIYNVEYHNDFGYSFGDDSIKSDDVDEDYIYNNWDDIKNNIIKDIKKGKRTTIKEMEKIKINKVSKKYNL